MPQNTVKTGTEEIKPPSPFSRRFVRAVVGFGVGVGLGLAPFLGNFDVPGFSPLLSLFPETLKGFLLPISAFLMGVIAAVIQFYSSFRLSSGVSRRYAKYALVVILSSLFLLMFLHRRFVQAVHFSPQTTASYVIGSKRTENCPCNKRNLSDPDCIKSLNANPDNIERCWSKDEVASRELSLSFIYLLLTGSFAYFIGLLLLRESAESKKKAGTTKKLKPNKPKAKKAVSKTQGE